VVVSSGVMFIPNFVQIVHVVQNLKEETRMAIL